jgi:hypothetical protein
MKIAALPVVLTLGLVLSACGGTPTPAETAAEQTPSDTPTATPTPDPAPPALADLVVTPEGLGTIGIGQAPAPDPATAMVVFDDDICVSSDFGIEAGDPLAGGWAPLDIYGDGAGTPTAGVSGRAAFEIFVKDDAVARIDVADPRIPTAEGVRVGDPLTAVTAAYPGVKPAVSSSISKVYRIPGTAGALDIEVKVETADSTGYWDADEVDTVGWIRVNPVSTAAYGVAGGDNVIFGCGYTP